MESNNSKSLKKFMNDDLVDQLFQPRSEELDRSKPKRYDSLEELYSDYKQMSGNSKGMVKMDPMEIIQTFVEAVKEITSRPMVLKVEIPEIPAPIVNVEVPAAAVKQGKNPAPIVKVETSKDMKNVLSAIKSLVDELKKSNKIGSPKFDINVKSELTMPDHEEVIEKVVKRDSLNRIQKTIATKKIVKK